MPEGPEVQTIVNGLRQKLLGARIENVRFVAGAQTKMLDELERSQFQKLVFGQTIEGINRLGKAIDIALESGTHIIVHLLMTGQIVVHTQTTSSNGQRYLRCIFELSDKLHMCIADKSTWVTLKILRQSELDTHPSFASLGPDVLTTDFSLSICKNILTRKKNIHSLLLDQKSVSGLGNIYVNESLYFAGVHPNRSAHSLSIDEVTVLYYSIYHVLREALKHRGTTFSDFRTADGEPGRYQNYLRVFKRAGKPCLRCGTPIRRIRIGGRGAFYCPREQSDELKTEYEKIRLEDNLLPVQPLLNDQMTSKIFAIIGPSSVGKTTLSRAITKCMPMMELMPTYKTRHCRIGENAGVDSLFLSRREFLNKERSGQIILREEIFGNLYGTPGDLLRATLAEGCDVCIILSENGAKELKRIFPNSCVIALEPPDEASLDKRARNRLDYSPTDLEDRASAPDRGSKDRSKVADYRIVARSEAQTLEEMIRIVSSTRCGTEADLSE